MAAPAGGVSMPVFLSPRCEELSARPLACFCRLGDPCHADVLISMANAKPYGDRDGSARLHRSRA